jgi:murein DD-endopeptidase MepM/ murein hydrolase activator NlpD
MSACILACTKPRPPRLSVELSSAEAGVWRRYLRSIESFLGAKDRSAQGVPLIEVRARLAENLATVGRAGVELPRALAVRAGRLLSALDARFEADAARATPTNGPGETHRASGAARRAQKIGDAGDEAFRLDDSPPTRVGSEAPGSRITGLIGAAEERRRADATDERRGAIADEPGRVVAGGLRGPHDDPDAEISESEIDDGGPAVDIVLPAPEPGALLRWPLLGARITSRFGARRDPIHGRRSFHDGVDISAKRGTPVLAAATGRVTFAGRRGGSGNVVVLLHTGGHKTVYAHLERIHVARGSRVRQGDIVGLVGSTGRSTGPHLHFVVRIAGKLANPLDTVGRTPRELQAMIGPR